MFMVVIIHKMGYARFMWTPHIFAALLVAEVLVEVAVFVFLTTNMFGNL